MESKKVLLVCYGFPPNPGVGGRRWAKFSKHLHREGFDVRLIRNTPLPGSRSNWSKDIELLEKNGKVFNVNNAYPKILSQTPTGLLGKVNYRLSLLYVKLFIKGNLFDRSTMWNKNLSKEVKKHISDGYTTIIASAAPFRYLETLSKIKDKVPGITLIGDFRDPWLNNTISYGFTSLSQKRFSEESVIQDTVFKTFNHFICVDHIHTSYINSKTIERKATCLPNGFDPEDFGVFNSIETTSDKINLIFTGSLYPKSEYIFSEFVETLKKLKKDNLDLFSRLQIDFYGSKPRQFDKYFNDPVLSEMFKFHGRVSLEKTGELISKASYAMLFLTEDLNYTKSTKFFEYIHLNKKIILFSKAGEMTDYIKNNKLGLAITPGKVMEGLLSIINGTDKGLTEKSGLDIEEHSVISISKKLKELLLTS